MTNTVADRTRKTLQTGFGLAIAALFVAGCASAPVTDAIRPAIGTTYSVQEAGLSAADQARLDAQCPLGQPKLRSVADFGITYLVARDGYAGEVSEKDKIPLWVCERITRFQVTGSLTGRTIGFRGDPLLPVLARAVDKDYDKSGFDRGHQAPLADQTREKRLRDETFYLSNAVPQNLTLNRQAWAKLEDIVRGWAEARDTVYAITGPMFWDPREDDPSTARGYVNYKSIGKNHVAVPTHIYKIVVARRHNPAGWDAIAFVVPNKPYDKSVNWTPFIKSISWIQKRAGITFLPGLPTAGASAVLDTVSPMWPQQ